MQVHPRQPNENKEQAALFGNPYGADDRSLPDPSWPEESFKQLDRAIDDMAAELADDPESAKLYYEYQARRAELA